MKRWSGLSLVVCAVLLWSGVAVAQQREKVLIRTNKPYGRVVAAIQANGGTVTHQYKFVNAIAAEVPRDALPAIRQLVGAAAITKDHIVQVPSDVEKVQREGVVPLDDGRNIPFDSVEALDPAEIAAIAGANPAAYLINNGIANVTALHAGGTLGQGVIVAVIDSGIRPGFPHISLDGSVIGCEDFVGDALGCSNSANNGHGTFVAGMISANVNFTFSTASVLRNAVLAECPACFANPPTNTVIPMVGTAPLSSIYALRVFGATGGAPTSRILAAIERVIDLRSKFDTGDPNGRNIQVCNMSLGGSTVFPGRDLFDQEVDKLIEEGIVPAIAAGNAGPSSLTVGSPGSAFSAITVGAASLPHNERILRDLQYGVGVGPLYRPFNAPQMSYFSGRGPNADGRVDPDIVANGFANYGQGTGSVSSISIGSGTSFSAPSVAGIAAVLRQMFPTATATQIRNAIVMGANPTILADDSTAVDQGAGYVDAGKAAALLASGKAPDALPLLPGYSKSVKVNVEKTTDLNVRDGYVTQTITGLKPGERFDLLYRVHPNTRQVVVTLADVTPVLPPIQQNQLFGDDILLAIHSAKTSEIGEGDYKVFEFTSEGTWTVDNPELGIMRITVSGDWTNAGEIGAALTVNSVTDPVPGITTQGRIVEGETIEFPVTIPAGVKVAEFRLQWREDWGNMPASDLDMILVAPDGTQNFAGAALNNPEHATVQNPAAGKWTVIVDGFEIPSVQDKFELRVALDGTIVK